VPHRGQRALRPFRPRADTVLCNAPRTVEITGVGQLAGELLHELGASFVELERPSSSQVVDTDVDGRGVDRRAGQLGAAVRRRGVLGAVPVLQLLLLLVVVMCFVVEVFRRRRRRYADLLFLVSLHTRARTAR